MTILQGSHPSAFWRICSNHDLDDIEAELDLMRDRVEEVETILEDIKRQALRASHGDDGFRAYVLGRTVGIEPVATPILNSRGLAAWRIEAKP